MATKCIFCPGNSSDAPTSLEHVFPEGIGGNLKLSDAVCRDCNSWLGHAIDSPLVNNKIVQLACLSYGISGKNRSVPNPFGKGTTSGQAQRVDYRLDKTGTPESTYMVTQVDVTERADGIEASIIVDESDRHQIPELLRKLVERRGHTVSEEELASAMQTPSTSEVPEIHYQWRLDIREIARALLKICYELTFRWQGWDSLKTAEMSRIRDAIMDRGPIDDWATRHPLHGTVRLVGDRPTVPLRIDHPQDHIATFVPQRGGWAAYVRIFNLFEAIVPLGQLPISGELESAPFIWLKTSDGSVEELRFIEAIVQEGSGGFVV